MPRIGEVEESQAWERAMYGSTTQDRLKNIANDSKDWRKRAGYPKDVRMEAVKKERVRDMKVHEWGQHMLQCRAWDDYNTEKVDKVVKDEIVKGQQAHMRLMKRKKVRGRYRGRRRKCFYET